MEKLNLAIDVFYQDNRANVVGVLFEKWNQSKPNQIITTVVNGVEDYKSGSFYKRELPCILQLLKQVEIKDLESIIVDGYVFLDKSGRKGLGYYLYETIKGQIPVIGVAKNYFHQTDAIVLYRGSSKKPLYITSIGIEKEEAAQKVSSMHGIYRFPTLLKLLDQQTRLPKALQ